MKKPVPANSGAQKPPSQLRFSLPSIIVHTKRIEIHESQRFLSTDTTKALVHAFVTSRVDYCNSLLYGLPSSHLNKVAAPALWNVLPREIRSITDLGIFKCHLKTHHFREPFY
ncbi:unnamed protein product [Porites lobata]|uniref:Uncharacterized protein n=1 Tax=Porites lobata TaxID=104759 RepID=A0ABN8P4E9_9CNID|nr:unnamed protein product [Porites lobata]